jgi:hypothetical protein
MRRLPWVLLTVTTVLAAILTAVLLIMGAGQSLWLRHAEAGP